MELLEQHLHSNLLHCSFELEELSLCIQPHALTDLLSFLKEHAALYFTQLTDICGVDYLFMGRSPRFEVVYHLLSLKHNTRLRIKLAVDEGDSVPSATSIYPCAGWFEREVFDLFGIPFSGHPDLRRILTDYGFEGHPLRKDFPLTGHVETTYDLEQKKVVYKKVELPQAFRTFDTLSPWEGMGQILERKTDEDAPPHLRNKGKV
ncbi:MAG: NADH-quinone oxidoreductase subunit C [Alphaproteobacteria bacterium]